MRQLIIDDFNGLQAFINLAEKAAKERNDVHFRVVNTDTDNTQKQIESKQNTIRYLRREIRQLKSLCIIMVLIIMGYSECMVV